MELSLRGVLEVAALINEEKIDTMVYHTEYGYMGKGRFYLRVMPAE